MNVGQPGLARSRINRARYRLQGAHMNASSGPSRLKQDGNDETTHAHVSGANLKMDNVKQVPIVI